MAAAAAACARRRLTTAGVAPMSWIATATPASGWREWKSRSTASQMLPKPRAEVCTFEPARRPGARLEQHLEVARADDADQHGANIPAAWLPVKLY
jgi:hypothetical protein